MKKTLMMLAALMTIALFAGCSDDDDDVLTPPEDGTEQGEETGNQGEENEGDENEGDENEGDENEGDENEGDENEGDENEGDENDGDENEGDENEGDENEGDENDGDDEDDDTKTDGVVPSTKVTEWSASVWEELNTTYGTDAVKEDFMYSDGLLYFCNGENGSGFKFSTSNSVYRVQLAGSGSTTQCCLQFKVSTNGTLYVDALSSSDKDVRTLNVYVNEDKVGEGISIELSTATREVKSLDVTTVSEETTISVASKSGGINVFTLKWVPEGVEE